MATKRRNWLWIIFGVFIVLVFLGIGVIIATTAWFQQNLSVTETTEGAALQEFDETRTKFGGRPPLLEVRDGRPEFASGKPPETKATTPVERLHVLVWDPDENRRVSVAIPMWLLRMQSGTLDFGEYTSGWNDERLNLRVEDIERYGPGIILDTTSTSGERVLLWAQ